MLVPDCVMSHLQDYNIHPHNNLKFHRGNSAIRYIFSNLEGGRKEKLHKYVVYVNFEVECHINISSDLIQRCGPVMTACQSLTHAPFFFFFCTLSSIYIKKKISEAGSSSVFRQTSTQPGEPLISSQSQSLGSTETFSMLRYEPENR